MDGKIYIYQIYRIIVVHFKVLIAKAIILKSNDTCTYQFAHHGTKSVVQSIYSIMMIVAVIVDGEEWRMEKLTKISASDENGYVYNVQCLCGVDFDIRH